MICSFASLGENLLNGWCPMRMRPAWMVSYASSELTDWSHSKTGGFVSHPLFLVIFESCKLQLQFLLCTGV